MVPNDREAVVFQKRTSASVGRAGVRQAGSVADDEAGVAFSNFAAVMAS